MQGAADDEADGEIELVSHRHGNSHDVLARVADDGNDDEANEGARDVEGLDDAVDAVDQVVRAYGYAERGEDQDGAGGPGVEFLVSRFFLFEEVRVRLGLEVEVDDVQD